MFDCYNIFSQGQHLPRNYQEKQFYIKTNELRGHKVGTEMSRLCALLGMTILNQKVFPKNISKLSLNSHVYLNPLYVIIHKSKPSGKEKLFSIE